MKIYFNGSQFSGDAVLPLSESHQSALATVYFTLRLDENEGRVWRIQSDSFLTYPSENHKHKLPFYELAASYEQTLKDELVNLLESRLSATALIDAIESWQNNSRIYFAYEERQFREREQLLNDQLDSGDQLRKKLYQELKKESRR
jgi:hypothetical protein